MQSGMICAAFALHQTRRGPPRCLLKQLLGARGQINAADGAHLLDAERPQPLHARRVKLMRAGKGTEGPPVAERVKADGALVRPVQ